MLNINKCIVCKEELIETNIFDDTHTFIKEFNCLKDKVFITYISALSFKAYNHSRVFSNNDAEYIGTIYHTYYFKSKSDNYMLIITKNNNKYLEYKLNEKQYNVYLQTLAEDNFVDKVINLATLK